jgi:SDR family mycofactocin-dependent oxidoreductase
MPEYDFSGTVAFVTGAAHGQGRSHAVNYAKHGADVVVTDICGNVDTNPYELGTSAELEETASMVEDEGQEALPIEMDVRDEAQVEAAVEEAVEEFGHVDILANNAGIFNSTELTEMDEAMWDDMIDTNLKGVWLCSKHVGKHFVDRGEGGKIVSTSSTAGFTGALGSGHYVATKHGVRGLTKTLALELAEYDVNVNAVAPTGVETPMIAGYTEAYGEEMLEEVGELTGPFNLFGDGGMIDAQDISDAYMWLSSDAAEYVTGTTIKVDAGYTAK